jgi:cytochrome c2
MGRLKAFVVVVVLALVVTLAACGEQLRVRRSADVTFGDAEIGRQLIGRYGCGSCHRIPGVDGADGLVGPPLDSMGRRTFIAGQLANTPENMVRWLRNPPKVEPGTAMPDLGISAEEARNIAAYLESLD